MLNKIVQIGMSLATVLTILCIVWAMFYETEKVIPGVTIILDRSERFEKVFPLNAEVEIVNIKNVTVSSTFDSTTHTYIISKVDRNNIGSITYVCRSNCILPTPSP